tara:strand:+ start:211 stop:459 length:249 start_codon:yes stop_codon:yes gene_type:complete
MLPNNMKELCHYVKLAKKQVANEHRRSVAHHGECSGLTDLEYNHVRINGKKTFSQQRKFVHSKMWSTHSEKYDLKQLKKVIK